MARSFSTCMQRVSNVSLLSTSEPVNRQKTHRGTRKVRHEVDVDFVAVVLEQLKRAGCLSDGVASIHPER